MKQSKETTEMGENRTGISLSPQEARKTAEGAQKDATKGSERQVVEARSRYVVESQGVGSLPKPAKRGAGKKAPKESNLRLLLDKLGERAAFERTGVRLYDAMIGKVEALGEKGGPALADLQQIRSEELEHFHLVAEHVMRLGGDSTAKSPCADVTGVASRGILQVLSDPRTTTAQCLSALLTAELTDNAGWELLIGLCDRLDEKDMGAAFQKALEQEREHLQKVRAWITEDLGRKLS